MHTGESTWYFVVFQDLFDMSTLDRLVVVDTSVAAGDGALAAFQRMSPSQILGGGQIIDPQDAKLYYVGS